MLLTSIETTPNPNSMKLNFDQAVEKAVTYTLEQVAGCPSHVVAILKIEGVKSVFACANFLTVNRDPRFDWKLILAAVNLALMDVDSSVPVDAAESDGTSRRDPTISSEHDKEREEQRAAAARMGQAVVLVQTFRGIPIQVKVTDATGEKRVALSAIYSEAAQAIQVACGADYLKERHWADWGTRYGAAEDVASEVVEEIYASIDSHELERRVAAGMGGELQVERRDLNDIKSSLLSADWQKRLKAVQDLSVRNENLGLLIKILEDEHHQVRRLAAAALGATGDEQCLDALCVALLNDSSVSVRRTAGDAISDIGNARVEPHVCDALKDSNKLVRWRAARFLNDLGTEYALPYLKEALGDEAFEVDLEVEAAIERISGGKAGSLPMWKKITGGR